MLIQTLAPDAEPVHAAAAHDAAGFLAGELERRREFGYPPFSSLIAVELTGPEEGRLAAAAERLAAVITPALGERSELLGPAPRFRRRNRFRRRLLVKTLEPEREAAAIGAALTDRSVAAALNGLTVAVDVDPQ